jgi:sulfide:quinone oxidoreductase
MSHHVPHVVVAGGGVGALEGVLALRALAEGRARITLLAPERHFTYRPLAVGEPFGLDVPRRFPLARIAADQGVTLSRDALERVDPDAWTVHTQGGDAIAYDVLVLALGARPYVAVPGALTFRGPLDVPRMAALVEDLRAGQARRLAVVVPPGASWSLPAYELALQTAATVPAAHVTLVTAEPAPLAAFGAEVGAAVSAILAESAVTLRIGAAAEAVEDGRLRLTLEGSVPADRVVALPGLAGPRVRGLPADAGGFMPVDEYGRVRGEMDIYAVGDMTARALKQGGLAAQQADVAAAHVAAHLGAPVDAGPYRPVLRGLLLTGRDVHLHHDVTDGAVTLGAETLSWPPGKIAGRHLAPYLSLRLELAGAPDHAAVPVSTSLVTGLAEPR